MSLVNQKAAARQSQLNTNIVSSLSSEVATLNVKNEKLANKGAANGYCPLDGNAKIAAGFLPADVMQLKGTWNANTNTPDLSAVTADLGDMYMVGVSGSTELDGNDVWVAGDRVLYDSTGSWKRIQASLSDVNVVAPAQDQVLVYDGGYWKNSAEAKLHKLTVDAGSVAGPSVTFDGATDTGLFLDGGQLAIAVDGVQAIAVGNAGVESYMPLTVPSTSVANPALKLSGASTGIYGSATLMGLKVNSVDSLHVTSTGLDLNGHTVTNGTISLPAGSAGSPSYTFSTTTNTGIYSGGAGLVSISSGGTKRAEVSGTGLAVTGTITGSSSISTVLVANGSVSAPSVAFTSETGLGLYRWTTGVTATGTVGGNQVRASTAFEAADGSAAAPSITFTSENDIGLYHSATDEISVSTGGAQRLRVSNSVTQVYNTLRVPTGGSATAPALLFDDGAAVTDTLSAATLALSGQTGMKCKIFTGTTAGTTAGSVVVAHGLPDITKVVMLTGTITLSTGAVVPTLSANGGEYVIPYLSGANLTIGNGAASSTANGRPYRVVAWYTV
ncbi:hypothetical protein CAOG_01744 [Capsaspora owczarzaki ATCC 30864]|uniref:hypothetical protein n=1 Tax=Capsaspora owczarzaki (strain ATCC 30864) TaxID=595528 RepID=UPI0001FE36AD|nr:hypothetical protein CAOG_01744 [Capsaspora owczarzaki ATCC 30864]|eukprot:XP_004364612.1 hypothetical protein CAOG_01744 [Capsaspora owczarzaki ATCC 30864]